MSYVAFVLDEVSQNECIKRFPSKFPDVYTHHVTLEFGVKSSHIIDQSYLPLIIVIGYVCDDSLESLIVTVDGNPIRKDGNKYHITLSLDKSKGRKPVDSNNLVNNTQTNNHIITPFILTGIVKLLF